MLRIFAKFKIYLQIIIIVPTYVMKNKYLMTKKEYAKIHKNVYLSSNILNVMIKPLLIFSF